MHTLIHLAVLTGTILVLAHVLSGVKIASVSAAVVTAIFFSVLNWGLGWLVAALLFVPGVLTFGLLFLVLPFVVNTVILWLTDKLVGAFEIRDFKSLLISSGAITLANAIVSELLRR